ncbi:hypothetical protein QJS10_CPB14g01177 [Acorus calamus]|uniref:Uncharacterized protein n=1 Tax=Acorus calamus TaxID=4465 RepID=A0AAV9DBM2_ACOCL|nr:hypothetical protein QJS10_CPB14g01177 [Acorus calamus]
MKQIVSLQSVHKDPPAEPSTPSMPQHGISSLSARNMDMSETLAVVDKVVENSTASQVVEVFQVVENSQMNEQHVVCNIESDSVQQSSSIRLGVPGVIEERRDYDGHDLLSNDEKGWIERFLNTPTTYETVLTTTKGSEDISEVDWQGLLGDRMVESLKMGGLGRSVMV